MRKVTCKPDSLLIHVVDVDKAAKWYLKAFPGLEVAHSSEADLCILKLGGFNVEIVKSDGKVSSGKFGTVMYWEVADFKETLDYFIKLGAKVYRGPMTIENNKSMCQLEDPFGNLIGLKGK